MILSLPKINLAKGSYLGKQITKGNLEAPKRSEKIVLSPEQRAVFEAGKVLLIDKPLHWTSFDVVRKVRNAIGIKKVGHAGTLDPLATGLLIICTGKFTKKINDFMAAEKTYTGTITLGAVTPTFDLESEPQDHKSISGIGLEEIKMAAAKLTGAIYQHPPVYSAIKKKGTPLYELVRRGENVETEARPVIIREFFIQDYEAPVISFKITCSTGTYIRSIAHDLGQILECGGYLSSLRRTAIGEQHVEDAVGVEEFLEELRQKG